MTTRAASIIRTLYGFRLQQPRRRAAPGPAGRHGVTAACRPSACMLSNYYRRRRRLRRILLLLIAVGVAMIVPLLLAGAYYFNKLTALEQDVFKSQARIDSLLQRRSNISTNLARTVRDYAHHEQTVFGHVSNARTSAQVGTVPTKLKEMAQGGANVGSANTEETPETPSQPSGRRSPAAEKPSQSERVAISNPMKEIFALEEGSSRAGTDVPATMSRLLAISERYPELKLSENFRRFMDALVETERAISDERIAYSETVNTYTTQLMSVPGRWFGMLYGFEDLPYYQANEAARRFRPVAY